MGHLFYQYVLCKPWNSKLPSQDDHCFLAFIPSYFHKVYTMPSSSWKVNSSSPQTMRRRRNMRTSRHITPVLHKASFFSFKRTACLRGQTRLQRQYRLFSFLLLWAAVLLLVLNLLQNSVHLRLWGGPQLCAGSIRDLSTLAREQQLTDWRLFSRPRTNEWEKHQFCVTIGNLSKNLY